MVARTDRGLLRMARRLPTAGPGGHTDAMDTPCCERMAADLQHKCDVHPDRFDCPDAFIARGPGWYGLMVHDGGSSVVDIAYCPWCGSKLPARDESDQSPLEDEEDD